MTEQQNRELLSWISRNFWKIDHWYEHLPKAGFSLGASPLALATGTSASELGFPVKGPEFVRAWDCVADQKRSGLKALCKRFQVSKLAGFGSAVRGTANSRSDLDLLVEFDPDAEIGFIALARLTDELSKLFEARVDLVPKDGLHPLIKDDVLAEAEVLFAA